MSWSTRERLHQSDSSFPYTYTLEKQLTHFVKCISQGYSAEFKHPNMIHLNYSARLVRNAEMLHIFFALPLFHPLSPSVLSQYL